VVETGGIVSEREYLRTVAELQEIARKAPFVTQEWLLEVASMDPKDMRRRLIRGFDWQAHYSHSLDKIPEIQGVPGGGIDGCRSHKEVRAIVEWLLERSRVSQCAWLDDEGGPRQTQCGKPFQFGEDGPAENGFRFCPYCGGALVVAVSKIEGKA
jgi:hypothetical protein